MKYCQDCGTPHECTAESAAEKAEVAIERLRTNRDIEVARIQASAAETIAETEAEHDASHAEGVAEGVTETLEAITGEGEGEPVTEGEPIIVETGEAEGEPEVLEPDNAPPVVEVAEPSAPKRPGWWDNYR